MTERQQLISDVSLHLRTRHPSHVTAMRIQEAITELGFDDVADRFDWTRLRNAIARRQFERYTRCNPRSAVTIDDIPSL